MLNADKLTIDAQSALRRCIELFSGSLLFDSEYKNFISSDFTSITCLPILFLSASGTFETVKIYLIEARAPFALPRCSSAFSLL